MDINIQINILASQCAQFRLVLLCLMEFPKVLCLAHFYFCLAVESLLPDALICQNIWEPQLNILKLVLYEDKIETDSVTYNKYSRYQTRSKSFFLHLL